MKGKNKILVFVVNIMLTLVLIANSFTLSADALNGDKGDDEVIELSETDEASSKEEETVLVEEDEETVEVEETIDETEDEVEAVENNEEVNEENVEVTEEEVQTSEENVEDIVINYPSFDETKTVNGVVINVNAAEGVFPEGSTLYVEAIDLSSLKDVDEAIEEKRNSDNNVVSSYTFDIKVLDAENNEIQPADVSKVKVSFKLEEVKNDNLNAQVYHISEDDLKVEELASENDGDTLVVETESFSYYTVEFTYNNLEYVLEGDGRVLLSAVLERLGLSGEVSEVTVSNSELFSVESENNEYVIYSHKPFTSKEWLKVTIDGIEYEITVTDEIPSGTVTSAKDMDADEVSENNNFTIGNGGVVKGPTSGTATIKNSTITNNAVNGNKGGYNSSNGSAFIARGVNSFNFENVTINSGANTLVFNIWANASINADSVILDGSANDDNNTAFLMVGAYPNGNAGTLNFSGNSKIRNTKGSIIGGNNSSNINVNDGTLTIENSDIKVLNGIKINVKSGATLIFDNSKFEQNTPTIILEDGATLIVRNGSTFSTIPNAGAFNVGNGTTVEVNNSTFNLGVNAGMNIAEGGNLNISNGSTFDMKGNDGNGINSNGDIKIEDSTVNGKGNKTKITSKGTLAVDNSNLKDTFIDHYTDVDITNGSDLNNCLIKSRENTTLNIEDSKLHDSNRSTEETMIHSSGDNVTVNITNCEVSDNTNTGTSEGSTIIKVIKGTLNVTGSTFTNNSSNAWGGAIYTNTTKTNITGSIFTGNKINNANNGGGGAIAVIDSPLVIKESLFDSNDANNHGKGGAVYINNNGKESLSIDDDSLFINNNAQFGGAVYINSVPDATIGAASFVANGGLPDEYDETLRTAQDGGAIYIESTAGKTEVTLNGTIFNQNSTMGNSYASGGSIYARGKDTVINVCGAKFTENVSMTYGGALTVAHDALANIKDLDGEPTEFIGNTVIYGTDHAGGGLFINMGYVIMDDSAIYNNYAKDGGGGISSCTKGSAEAKVLDGTAIFDNHVGKTFLDDKDPIIEDEIDLRGQVNKWPDQDGLIESYPDIYFETKDHRNADTGEILTDWEGHPTYIIELYERMFNGGVHRWDAKPFAAIHASDPPVPVNSFMAKSNPTNKDISEAKVIFTENVATNLGETAYSTTGGAIGCNGLLQMGTGTEIKIVKVWDDDRNNDGYRPDLDERFIENLIVKANDEPINLSDYIVEIMDIKDFDPAALANNIVNVKDPQKDYSDYDAWVIVISGLRLRDDNDELIKYTVSERDPEYYSLIENLGDNETYFEMKNRHNPDLVNISVTKAWEDNDDQDGKRPQSITVRLYADDEEVDSATISNRNNWQVSFEGLPRFNDRKEIVYTIGEDDIKDYTANIKLVTPDADNQDEKLDNDKIEELDQPVNTKQIIVEKEFVITNTHEPEKIELTVTKTWEDNDDQDGLRPDSIAVVLKGSDGKSYEQTLTEENDWSYTFEDLPKYHEGKEIVYTVEESVEIDGYTVNVKDLIITNKHDVIKTEVSGKKTWVDGNDEDGIRPESITVNLLADGELVDSKQVTEKDNWSYSFTGLDKFKEGKEIVYTIGEELVEGYTKQVDGYDLINTHVPNDKPVKTVNGKETFVLTNRDQDIVFTISQKVPENCKEMIFTDDIPAVLEITGMEINVGGVNLDISKLNIKVVLNEDQLKDLEGEIITLVITTKIKEDIKDSDLAEYTVKGINNEASVEVDGILNVTNRVKVVPDIPKKEKPKKYTVPKTGVE